MARVERLYNEQAVAQRMDGSAGRRKRVAAYCRVSTDNEGQMSSLELQMAAFRTQIELRPDWELVDIYSDEGISGTRVSSAGVNLRKKQALSGYVPMHISSTEGSSARNAEPLTGGGRSRKGMPKVVRATRPGAARNAAREKPEMVVQIRSCAKSRYWKPSPGSLEWRVSTNRLF